MKRDKDQLTSARKLLEEHEQDVDVFEIKGTEGVEQLCWGMKKIARQLLGKVVEIGIDATCEFYPLCKFDKKYHIYQIARMQNTLSSTV
jgi:hypothetical protein